MELQAFIKQTLVQIVKGVEQARVEIEKAGGSHHGQPTASSSNQEVHFDVVLAEEGDTVGVASGSATAGAPVDAEAPTHGQTRIRFTVPLTLPVVE